MSFYPHFADKVGGGGGGLAYVDKLERGGGRGPPVWMIFRCNRLNRCISRNRIFSWSLTPSMLLSSFQGLKGIKQYKDRRWIVCVECVVYSVYCTVYSVKCIVYIV
jgi:hypothetical protein